MISISNTITLLLNYLPLQLQPQPVAHPYITDLTMAAIIVALIAIGVQFIYAFLRKRFTDMEKMKKIMQETRDFRKEYLDAIKRQDKKALEKLKERKPYIDKVSMDIFNMNMKPMLIFMIPMFIIWIYILPSLIGNTSAISPISLNLLGDLIPLTCTRDMIVNDVNSISNELINSADKLPNRDRVSEVKSIAEEAKQLVNNNRYVEARGKLLEGYAILNSDLTEKIPEKVPRCVINNEVLLWAWYFIVSIAFSSIIMRITKTHLPVY